MPNLPPKPGIGCAAEPAALFAGHGNGIGTHFLGAFERERYIAAIARSGNTDKYVVPPAQCFGLVRKKLR